MCVSFDAFSQFASEPAFASEPRAESRRVGILLISPGIGCGYFSAYFLLAGWVVSALLGTDCGDHVCDYYLVRGGNWRCRICIAGAGAMNTRRGFNPKAIIALATGEKKK